MELFDSGSGEGDDELYAADISTARFDDIVAALEDVILHSSFEDRVEAFFRAHCHRFTPGEENATHYTVLFGEYTSLVEGALMGRLSTIPGFLEAELEGILQDHAADLVGEVFDVLMSLGDFESFKSTMLAWREQVESEAERGGRARGGVAGSGAETGGTTSSSCAVQTSTEWAADFGRPKGGAAGLEGVSALSLVEGGGRPHDDFADLVPTVIHLSSRQQATG